MLHSEAQAIRCSLDPCVGASKRNCARQRPRARPNSVPIIAALHQPLTILAANNLADVVSPDDDNANGRTTSIYAEVSPSSREVVLRARIAAYLTAHVPPAPCSGTPSVPVGKMLGSCFCVRRESAKQCHRRNDFTHTIAHRCCWVAVPSEDAAARV